MSGGTSASIVCSTTRTSSNPAAVSTLVANAESPFYYIHILLHALLPEPEGGAQCVSSARWDLCGGRRVTGVPTATV